MNSHKPLISITGTAVFLAVSSSVWVSDADAQAQNQPPAAQQQGQQAEGADIQVQQPAPQITVQQPAPQVQVQQPAPKVTVQQPPPEVTVQQPPPQVTVQQPQPEVTVEQAKPEVTVQQQGQPQVTVQEQGKAQVQIREGQQAMTAQPLAVPQAGWRSTKLTGREVRNVQGEELAEIHDFIIRRDGQASQVILNVEDKKVAVPFNNLQFSGPDTVIYQGTKQQLAQLPAYREGQFAGAEYVPPLVGRDVRNAQNEQIGKVDDLIIGPDGRVGVVLSVGGFLGVGDRLVHVPFHAVQLTGQDYLLYEGSKEQLAQLPAFDYDQLQRGIGGAEQPARERRRDGVVE
jgi:uncharacterized protein YrrD